MAEVPKNIDSKTLELLTSSSFDPDQLTKGRPSLAAFQYALKVVPKARALVQERGTPPWDRLELVDKAFIMATKPEGLRSETAQSIHFRAFSDGVVAVRGKITTTPVNQTLNGIAEWVEKSPLRRVEFPFEGRTVSMMLTHPEAEETVKLKASLPFFEEVIAIALPSIQTEDCLLAFRTDAWVNTESGNPRWMGLALGTNRQGIMPVNRAIVRCVEAITMLGNQHFLTYQPPSNNLPLS